ncbi:hypothetical protein Hypma_010890 [Hypsizygus marmoreus]|uniref:Uncharacterized protein n=1 Tax=Hypsizygus marmoreus TaxID=39966 RepID=A0A369JIE5_HYPMA|nr:hypothetical protein Hypma_010890 [Hypsizygus marmoreus]
MFEQVCETPKVDFALRLRFCGACHKKNIYRGAAIARDADWGKIPLTIYTSLPRAKGSSELESTCNSSINTPCHAYYAPELHAVKDQYSSLLKGDAALASFVKERQDFATRLMQLLEWDSKCKNQEKMKCNEKILDRQDDVEDRLVKLGWNADNFPFNDWGSYATIWRDAWISFIRQPRALTDKSWDNSRPQLVYILERVIEEFSKLWTIYLEQFPLAQRDLMLNGREAANSPIIKACLAEDKGKIEITAERFDVLVPTALAEVEGHLRKIEQYLIAYLTDSSFTANALAAALTNKDHDALRHAATLSDCPSYRY